MESKQLKFWKFYFYITSFFAFCSYGLSIWVLTATPTTPYAPTISELIPFSDTCITLVSFTGLYGLAFQRTVHIQPIWKIFWLFLLLYELYQWFATPADFLEMFMWTPPAEMPEALTSEWHWFAFAIPVFTAIGLIISTINIWAIFKFAFQSEHLWQTVPFEQPSLRLTSL